MRIVGLWLVASVANTVIAVPNLTDVGLSPTCLYRNLSGPLKTLQYADKSTSTFKVPYASWASAQVLSQVVSIILKEYMGYSVELLNNAASSSSYPIWYMAGCVDPDDATCAVHDINFPKIHVSIETWQYGKDKAGTLPVDLRPTLVQVYDYPTYTGFYVWEDTVNEAANGDDHLALDYFKSYDARLHEPYVYFDPWQKILDLVPRDYIVRCSDMGPTSTFSRRASDYIKATNNTQLDCLDDIVWISPACRANTSKCLPVVVQYDYPKTIQEIFFLNIPAALVMVAYGTSDQDAVYYGAIQRAKFLFGWYQPDDSLIDASGKLPIRVQLPANNALEHANGIFRTGNADFFPRNYIWSKLQSVDRFSWYLMSRMSFYSQDMDNMMIRSRQLKNQKLSTDAAIRQSACDWITSNLDRWESWLPAECAAGKYTSNLVDCVACPAGSYCPGPLQEIATCPIGTYCPAQSSAPISCPGGGTTLLPGSTDSGDCSKCPPGKYDIAGACASTSEVVGWVVIPAVVAAIIVFLIGFKGYRLMHRGSGDSRRLIGAPSGTRATQRDLPYPLRRKYEAVQVLGSGAFGVVLEAWQMSNKTRTARRAIKLVHAQRSLLSEKELRRLDRESLLLSQLMQEKFIVTYVESGRSDDLQVYWCVMELIEGRPMDAVLSSQGPLNEAQAIKIGLDMCSALKSLHNLGVIHRDVKPSNIMRVEGSLLFMTETSSSDGPATMTGNFRTLRSQAGPLVETEELVRHDSKKGPFLSQEGDANFDSKGRREVFKFAEEKVDAAIAFGKPMALQSVVASSKGPNRGRRGQSTVTSTVRPGNEVSYKLIDLGTAVAIADAGEDEAIATLMTVTQLEFAGTPAYSPPESFIDAKTVNFYSDVWSLAATIFHLVAGRLPFEVSSVAAAASLIADMTKPTPDIRDCMSEEKRSTISQAFAQVLAKGLEKDPRKRYQTVDDMATDLYGCLVSRGEGVYTAFISYRVASEKFHAQLLYQLLNNTVTPAGNRVIVYLDVKRLVKGEDWEQGFALGLLNSLVAVPLVSKGLLEPLLELHGAEDDRQDNLLKELVIMQMLMEAASEGRGSTLRTVFPVLVGSPHPEGHAGYPYTGNLFVQGSPAVVKHLSRLPSPPTAEAVADFLERRGLPGAEEARSRGVAQIIQELFSVQAAQLWNHGGELPVEDMAGEESLEAELQKEPPDPPLDAAQFRAIKAELRALVPSIHEVIDRAYVSLASNPPAAAPAALLPTTSHSPLRRESAA
eukprot:CAMPEP_0113680028 /NCGR_PEP_ID=MMETSP0038_2-20120614/11027_1 /TAXON_ID=2898 /ORGANISM="Cryptomonas paramecium" /LENGTH=1252 /DNA_ID=CAMNT_0000598235 /DNA_START=30 /DNA_END=3785 /DNA_ORIENTATION=+ /assembly_acc=CAM_ASM_000170